VKIFTVTTVRRLCLHEPEAAAYMCISEISSIRARCNPRLAHSFEVISAHSSSSATRVVHLIDPLTCRAAASDAAAAAAAAPVQRMLAANCCSLAGRVARPAGIFPSSLCHCPPNGGTSHAVQSSSPPASHRHSFRDAPR